MAETDSGKQAKVYLRPTLTIYGKVQELTKANFTTGGQDSGNQDPRKRTQM
jgi:hypothetical protein